MKVSRLIKELQQAKSTFGDLEIEFHDGSQWRSPCLVTGYDKEGNNEHDERFGGKYERLVIH